MYTLIYAVFLINIGEMVIETGEGIIMFFVLFFFFFLLIYSRNKCSLNEKQQTSKQFVS